VGKGRTKKNKTNKKEKKGLTHDVSLKTRRKGEEKGPLKKQEARKGHKNRKKKKSTERL